MVLPLRAGRCFHCDCFIKFNYVRIKFSLPEVVNFSMYPFMTYAATKIAFANRRDKPNKKDHHRRETQYPIGIIALQIPLENNPAIVPFETERAKCPLGRSALGRWVA